MAPQDFLRQCSALIEGFADPVLVVGADRRIVAENPAARDLFGRPTAGDNVLTVIRQPDPVQALERVLSQLADPEAPPQEARMFVTDASGETVWKMRAKAVRLDAAQHDEPGFVLVTLRDISHVETAEQQRRDFVANVSHEMRSPLTVLTGFIETLRGPAKNDPVATQNFLKIMDKEAQRMTRLVSDLLSLSRVESEERIRPRAQTSISEVLRATLAALRPQAEDAGLDVRFTDLPDLAPIHGDRDQLVQVFRNLIENALKYGASGGVIDVTIERADNALSMSGPVVKIHVRDYGDGIDAIHLPRLTERFYRVDGHRSRAMGGTGLGLAIVKHIINRHRGRLLIRSTRGEGTTFTVILPLG